MLMTGSLRWELWRELMMCVLNLEGSRWVAQQVAHEMAQWPGDRAGQVRIAEVWDVRMLTVNFRFPRNDESVVPASKVRVKELRSLPLALWGLQILERCSLRSLHQ